MRPTVASTLIVLVSWVALATCTTTSVSAGCHVSPPRVMQREAAAALDRYQRLLRAQDSAALAAMFVPGGRLEHVGQDPIVGRERIRAFLASFADYRVLSHDMTVTASTYGPCHANQSGTYVQHVRAPDGQQITARGWFLFQWQKQAGGQWLLESARTSSTPLPDAG